MSKQENYGAVTYNGVTITLTQMAYCSNAGQYRASGRDADSNEYEVEWVTTSAWDAAQDAARNGDVSSFAEDETNACDWDDPVNVKKV